MQNSLFLWLILGAADTHAGGIRPVPPEQPHGPLPTQRQTGGSGDRKRRGRRRQRNILNYRRAGGERQTRRTYERPRAASLAIYPGLRWREQLYTGRPGVFIASAALFANEGRTGRPRDVEVTSRGEGERGTCYLGLAGGFAAGLGASGGAAACGGGAGTPDLTL